MTCGSSQQAARVTTRMTLVSTLPCCALLLRVVINTFSELPKEISKNTFFVAQNQLVGYININVFIFHLVYGNSLPGRTQEVL